MYKILQQCRACAWGANRSAPGIKAHGLTEKLVPVFNLGIQPLANDFCTDGDERGGYAPLQVLFCPRCSLAQLSVVVRPEILYRHYAYVTSPSVTMQQHFEHLYEDLQKRTLKLDRILEIGSNDGRFLDWLARHGHKVCGIDPAENLHPDAVESICDVLCYGSAELARFKLGAAADVIIARHVFCHVDDWVDFFKSLEAVSHSETVIGIEVPYVGNLLAKTEWDTIYHEHLSYLSFKAMVALLERTNFRLSDILEYDIHGGAVLLLVRHKDSIEPANEDARRKIEQEKITEEHWHQFNVRAQNLSGEIHDLVKGLTHGGKTVCAFGASAKATVLLNACRLSRKEVSFVTDTTKGKWYRTVPGTDIPVVDPGALLRELPDYALMCCWNFAEEVVLNNKVYLEKGGHFIVPIPKVTIIP